MNKNLTIPVSILKNVAIFAGVLFAFAFNQLFHAPKAVVGWSTVLFLSLSTKHWDLHWVVYSVIFWACDTSREDHSVLIALTTLVYATLIPVSVLLPDHNFNALRRQVFVLVCIVTSLPVSCNNLLFHPYLGVVRFATFQLLTYYDQNHRNLTLLYILFAKTETLIPLVVWHGIVVLSKKKLNLVHPVMLPVKRPEEQQEEDDNDHTDI